MVVYVYIYIYIYIYICFYRPVFFACLLLLLATFAVGVDSIGCLCVSHNSFLY